MHTPTRLAAPIAALTLGLAAWVAPAAVRAQQDRSQGPGFSFTTAVDLVAVTATVTDRSGRFVSGLRAEDFSLYEDGKPQTISQFDAERVPVSLGIVLDTSGSMAGEKISAAQQALGRFVDLLGPRDEMLLYRFDTEPRLVQGWTQDRDALVRRLGAVRPNGGTALYDAVAEAVPAVARGTKRKKALVIISDGNDRDSGTSLADVQQLIRESEVLVYAIGLDGEGDAGPGGFARPRSFPIPMPGGPIFVPMPRRPQSPPQGRSRGAIDAGVNAGALRMMTDDSGGRTEIISSPRDLNPATAGIADELSKQYFLGYVSTLPKDGRWHAIDVRLRRGADAVRARKGYLASSELE